MKLKFDRIYKLIMEQVSPTQIAKIDQSTDSFISDLETDHGLKKLINTQNGDKNTKDVLKQTVKQQVKRTIDAAFLTTIKSFLNKKNISYDIFEANFLHNYYDDIEKFFTNSKNATNLAALPDESSNIVNTVASTYKISEAFVNEIFNFSFKKNRCWCWAG